MCELVEGNLVTSHSTSFGHPKHLQTGGGIAHWVLDTKVCGELLNELVPSVEEHVDRDGALEVIEQGTVPTHSIVGEEGTSERNSLAGVGESPRVSRKAGATGVEEWLQLAGILATELLGFRNLNLVVGLRGLRKEVWDPSETGTRRTELGRTGGAGPATAWGTRWARQARRASGKATGKTARRAARGTTRITTARRPRRWATRETTTRRLEVVIYHVVVELVAG